MNWTPYQIEIMLHHYSSRSYFPRAHAPAYPETLKGLVDFGLLTHNDGEIRPTWRGEALVKLWCSTPAPEMRFVDPRKWQSDEAIEAADDIRAERVSLLDSLEEGLALAELREFRDEVNGLLRRIAK